jgi:hypothetical protein
MITFNRNQNHHHNAVKATIITGAKGISSENDIVKFMTIGSPHFVEIRLVEQYQQLLELEYSYLLTTPYLNEKYQGSLWVHT